MQFRTDFWLFINHSALTGMCLNAKCLCFILLWCTKDHTTQHVQLNILSDVAWRAVLWIVFYISQVCSTVHILFICCLPSQLPTVAKVTVLLIYLLIKYGPRRGKTKVKKVISYMWSSTVTTGEKVQVIIIVSSYWIMRYSHSSWS